MKNTQKGESVKPQWTESLLLIYSLAGYWLDVISFCVKTTRLCFYLFSGSIGNIPLKLLDCRLISSASYISWSVNLFGFL